jgi:hypothetical protein
VLAHLGWGSLGGGQSERFTPWLGFSWERLKWVFGELRGSSWGRPLLVLVKVNFSCF